MPVSIVFQDESVKLHCLELTGREHLGEASTLSLRARADEPMDARALVGKTCVVHVDGPHGERALAGLVWSVTASLKASREVEREYLVVVRSAIARLELRRRSAVYQHMTVPAIVKHVMVEGGLAADDVELRLAARHAPREYVTQYDETDAAFVRRLCEEEGLYFRHAIEEERERFLLEDTSTHAAAALDAPLPIEDRHGVETDHARVYDLREARRRKPGKVTLRAYDPMKPALALEGMAKAGTRVEEAVEVYRGAARFGTPEEGKQRATARLEAERAMADVVTFTSNASALRPGTKCSVTPAPSYVGVARPTADLFIVEVTHAWNAEDNAHRVRVEAIPLATPFRLPVVTPRPRALGVHSAIVTGATGEEIHTDAQGRVRVSFLWDRTGPKDDKSSLFVRVMQPSMPGSMIIPRVGWEVWVMFEDGDPDCPYVLGRTYNGRQPPPVALPTNRTMTLVQTLSSPGGKAMNSISFDDAAGRQHLRMVAAKDQSITVAHDARIHTAKVDDHVIGGDLKRTVGAAESVSVTQAYLAQVGGSQTATVGVDQHLYVKGSFSTDVKSESVTIGAALLEQIGNPVTGLTNLATAAALQGVAAIQGVGPYLAAAGGLGLGAYQGYKAGGTSGAAQALGMGALGLAAGRVPGGDALMASVQTAAAPAPWHDRPSSGGAQEAGGGATAAADSGQAEAAGTGQRVQIVKGTMTEVIGGSYGLITPGSVSWKTTGASTLSVGGSHLTKAKAFAQNVKGNSNESLGGQHVKSGARLQRVVDGEMKTTIEGACLSDSGGAHHVKVKGALTLTVGGALAMKGSTVTFVVGSAKVSASPGGVLVQADEVKITGDSKQSSKTTHL